MSLPRFGGHRLTRSGITARGGARPEPGHACCPARAWRRRDDPPSPRPTPTPRPSSSAAAATRPHRSAAAPQRGPASPTAGPAARPQRPQRPAQQPPRASSHQSQVSPHISGVTPFNLQSPATRCSSASRASCCQGGPWSGGRFSAQVVGSCLRDLRCGTPMRTRLCRMDRVPARNSMISGPGARSAPRAHLVWSAPFLAPKPVTSTGSTMPWRTGGGQRDLH